MSRCQRSKVNINTTSEGMFEVTWGGSKEMHVPQKQQSGIKHTHTRVSRSVKEYNPRRSQSAPGVKTTSSPPLHLLTDPAQSASITDNTGCCTSEKPGLVHPSSYLKDCFATMKYIFSVRDFVSCLDYLVMKIIAVTQRSQ